MEHIEIEDNFTEIGGQFISSAFMLSKALKDVKAFVFDWDGVFNDGRTSEQEVNSFSEVDVNGLNHLRFGQWLCTGNKVGLAIISENDSPSAHYFAKHEHFDALYAKTSDKKKALLHFCDVNGFTPKEVCYIYDDVQDVNAAKECGIKIAIGRLCNPVFLNYIIENNLADYLTACQGSEHAVRELSELLLCIMDKENEVFEKFSLSDDYVTHKAQYKKTNVMTYRLDTENQSGIGFKPGV